MLCSMTAYGRQEISLSEGTISCELRSVNHRYLDCSLRLPEELRPLEPKLRQLFSENLSRGKLECGMRFHKAEVADAGLSVNQALAAEIIAASENLLTLMPAAKSLATVDVLKWPGVVETAELNLDAIRKAALDLAKKTLTDYKEARQREGDKIVSMIETRCDQIQTYVESLRELRPQALKAAQNKIRERLAELESSVDPQRIEQELVFLAQKMDVEEELDRLEAHVTEVRDVLKRNEPVGRRLDFLMQELNREANTLGSKSNDTETTKISVDIKVLIEQIREQVQNVE